MAQYAISSMLNVLFESLCLYAHFIVLDSNSARNILYAQTLFKVLKLTVEGYQEWLEIFYLLSFPNLRLMLDVGLKLNWVSDIIRVEYNDNFMYE